MMRVPVAYRVLLDVQLLLRKLLTLLLLDMERKVTAYMSELPLKIKLDISELDGPDLLEAAMLLVESALKKTKVRNIFDNNLKLNIDAKVVTISVFLVTIRDASLFSGRATIWRGGRVIIFFPLVWGRITFFFTVFLGEGHKFFKVFFIEKINYEYPAAAGFPFLLILPLPSKKKCPEGRNKTIYMNLDVRYCILKEGQTDRRILLFHCYV